MPDTDSVSIKSGSIMDSFVVTFMIAHSLRAYSKPYPD